MLPRTMIDWKVNCFTVEEEHAIHLFVYTRNMCQVIAKKQECIPVGWVPSAAVAVGGGALPMGMSAWGDRMTEACENITLPQLLLSQNQVLFLHRVVVMSNSLFFHDSLLL